MLGASVMYAET